MTAKTKRDLEIELAEKDRLLEELYDKLDEVGEALGYVVEDDENEVDDEDDDAYQDEDEDDDDEEAA